MESKCRPFELVEVSLHPVHLHEPPQLVPVQHVVRVVCNHLPTECLELLLVLLPNDTHPTLWCAQRCCLQDLDCKLDMSSGFRLRLETCKLQLVCCVECPPCMRELCIQGKPQLLISLELLVLGLHQLEMLALMSFVYV
jgi:hypothetical protein